MANIKTKKNEKKMEGQDCSDNPDSQRMVPHTSRSGLSGYSELTFREV